MSRASRLLALLQQLRRRRSPVSGPTLAKELGVSIRTLYRDIATLQEQGADIQGEPGLGYVLRPGFTLPPLMFSVDEIEALVLGSRWVAARSDARLGAAAENAVAKIRAVLPASLRDSVDAATSTVPFVEPPEPVRVDVADLRAAIRAEHKITIAYRDGGRTETRRTIWPISIGVFERVLVVAAFCELRQDYRGFRLDRIVALEPSGTRYPRKRAVMVKEFREREMARSTARN
ncbi:Transcriptional regulator, DeoR family [Labilithrix luteola]|uniref:Transcriptional regulator, DeoR family n=1 Tax=Labilithrix luteola TaxID=1391654 RepID=A0A0K1Q3M7_9BACT|nr:YafY family protein [Labilithrix luteola]AKV00354.1 Transcriptional regulator, DeoR family [Labilithrix luteola]